jgi:hypothetical protein
LFWVALELEELLELEPVELELQALALLAGDGELEVELAAEVAPNEPAPGAVACVPPSAPP